MRFIKLLGIVFAIHALAYFGTIAIYGYSPDRAFLLRYFME